MTSNATTASSPAPAAGGSTELPPLREAFQQFLRLIVLIRAYWPPLIKGIALGLLLGVIGMAVPYVSKLLIDEVYPTGNTTLLHVLVGGILAIAVAETFLGTLRGYFTQFTMGHLTSATHLLFFNHLQHLPNRFFDSHRVGEIMSRFSDVRSSLTSVSRIFETLFVNGVYLLLVPPFLFVLNWKLALVTLATLPVSVLITVWSARLLRRYWKRTAEAHAELSAHQMETLSHIRTLKSMALEDRVYHTTASHTSHALNAQLKASGLGMTFGALTSIVRALGTALFTWYGWHLVLGGEITLGTFIAFAAYAGYLHGPLTQITNLFSDFQQSAVSLGRMYEYLDREPEQDPTSAYAPTGPVRHVLSGDVRLSEVQFGYTPSKPVLSDVDLLVPEGQITAIVGPSGAGKSSLLRLIAGVERPTGGGIFFGDVPADRIPLVDLRRQVAVVWQEYGLLRGSIRHNLTLGVAVDDERLDEAVRLCRLDTLLAEMPDGYETPVGEWGATLSGGQRQRLALARALLRDTPVLLLDEVTANVDPETESGILRDLFTRVRKQTVVFVTHRTRTAALADRIVIVEHGRITAVGSHAELAAESETYRRMIGATGSEPPATAGRPRPLVLPSV